MNKPIKFYDLVKKKFFTSSTYSIKSKGNRTFAVAVSPLSGKTFWRAVSKDSIK